MLKVPFNNAESAGRFQLCVLFEIAEYSFAGADLEDIAKLLLSMLRHLGFCKSLCRADRTCHYMGSDIQQEAT